MFLIMTLFQFQLPFAKPVVEPLLTPRQVYALVRQDCEKIPESEQPFIRYFCRAGRPQRTWDNLHSCGLFVVNSLSQRIAFARFTEIGPLLRIDLRSITGQKLEADHMLKAWEWLGEHGSGPNRIGSGKDNPEPYYHRKKVATIITKEKVKKETGQYVRGRFVYDEEEQEKIEQKFELVHGDTLNPEDVKYLTAAMKTEYPVFRMDWFICNAMFFPGYFKFLGVKDLESFDKVVRFKQDDIEDIQAQGVILKSRIRMHNGSLIRSPTVLGNYWESRNYFSSTGMDNIMLNLLKKEFDEIAVFASIPNGLNGYFAGDKEGKAIPNSSPHAEFDNITRWRRKLIYAGYSCAACHEAGLQPIRDSARRFGAKYIKLLSNAKSPKDAVKIDDRLSQGLDTLIQQDTDRFTFKLKECNGLTPAKNASIFADIVIDNDQKDLTLEDMALEEGVTVPELVTALKLGIGIDTCLTGAIQDPPEPVRRDQWEARGFAEAAALIHMKRNGSKNQVKPEVMP